MSGNTPYRGYGLEEGAGRYHKDGSVKYGKKHTPEEYEALKIKAFTMFDELRPSTYIAKALHLSTSTIGKWKKEKELLRIKGNITSFRLGDAKISHDKALTLAECAEIMSDKVRMLSANISVETISALSDKAKLSLLSDFVKTTMVITTAIDNQSLTMDGNNHVFRLAEQGEVIDGVCDTVLPEKITEDIPRQ